MKLFDRFKKSEPPKEEKSDIRDYDYASDDISLANVLGYSTGVSVYTTPRYAYYTMERNSDLGKAIGSISKAISHLKKVLRYEDDEEVVENPILNIIKNPGGGLNCSQFFREMSESFLLTQSIYVVARGNINRPPLELDFIRPYDISLSMTSNEPEPTTITTTSNRDRRTYTKERIDGRIRYIDKTGLNELIIIRGAISIFDNWSGRSPLNTLYYDILMNTDGKRHNTSLLKKGLRTSAVITPPTTGTDNKQWNEKQVKTVTNTLRSFNQGAGNAGEVLLLSVPAAVQGLTQNNKDMDFVSLLNKSQDAIYNLYDIPLPLIKDSAMTYDNYTTANRMFYTEAVFPVYTAIAEGLLNNLRHRYNLDEKIILSYDETSISAMRTVLIENMDKLSKTSVVSTNESRRVGGFKDVPNGDTIFVDSNKVPLGIAGESLSFQNIEEEEDEPEDTGEFMEEED